MEAVSGVRLADAERERVEKLVKLGYYINESDFLRDAVRSKLKEFEIVLPTRIPAAKLKSEIFRIIKGKPNIYADEVAAELGIDIEATIHLIDELITEKKVTA